MAAKINSSVISAGSKKAARHHHIINIGGSKA